jgi:hypothetical protein
LELGATVGDQIGEAWGEEVKAIPGRVDPEMIESTVVDVTDKDVILVVDTQSRGMKKDNFGSA